MELKATATGFYGRLIHAGEIFTVKSEDEKMFDKASWVELVEKPTPKPKAKPKSKAKRKGKG